MSETTIYVVMGTTGEYSDRDVWPVKAFRAKPAAEALVEAASEIARAHFAKAESAESRWQIYREFASDLDPDGRMDYTGTSYFIHDVELAD